MHSHNNVYCRGRLSDSGGCWGQSDACRLFVSPCYSGQPLVKFKGCDRRDVGQQAQTLESLYTGVHCAAILNDPVLFLAALIILSLVLTLFPSTQSLFVYFLLLSFLQLMSSLVLFVDLTLSSLCPGPLFRLCFLSLTAERKKSGSWHPKNSQGRNTE